METNPIAIIVPAEPALKKLANSIGVQGHGVGDLVHDPRIRVAILEDMQAVGKRAGLVGMEIISGVVLADEEWTPENVSAVITACFGMLMGTQNLVTPTSKLNRRRLFERYKTDIETVYGQSRS